MCMYVAVYNDLLNKEASVLRVCIYYRTVDLAQVYYPRNYKKEVVSNSACRVLVNIINLIIILYPSFIYTRNVHHRHTSDH